MGLCLSGGGFRATLFHLGALRRLNETGMLSKMNTISSVSGGSIANGLLSKAWPSLAVDKEGVFTNFGQLVEQPLREFCSHNIRDWPILWGRLWPGNWRRLTLGGQTAANLLADMYENRLVPGLTLNHLTGIHKTEGPNFVFCATNLQTGVNFTLNAFDVGDWMIGHTPARDLPLSKAVAASSAFPMAFPPLILHPAAEDRFTGGKLARSPNRGELIKAIRLTDGGVYDNLGLEPVWKDHEFVFCSDGGQPFTVAPRPGKWSVSRLSRASGIVGNQALAVRKRWLISSYEKHVYGGCYWGIGTDVGDYGPHFPGYHGDVLNRLRKVRTDLNPFTEQEQLTLMNHGWALASAALQRWCPQVPAPAGATPCQTLLTDYAATMKALKYSDSRFRVLARIWRSVFPSREYEATA
ncbi:MAG TPA: patatin-like phospholipase family protein [Pirellulales bacterium]|nr:patatin-like phospholipase family protein [Pirellulales bacterium]